MQEYGLVNTICIDCKDFIRILEAYWYGDTEPDEREIETMQKLRNELKEIKKETVLENTKRNRKKVKIKR